MQTAVFDGRFELFRLGRHHIHVRREDNAALNFAGGGQANEQIFAPGQNGLAANVEADLAGAIDQ